MFRIHGQAARMDHAQLAGLVVLAAERTHGDDPGYGFRKLVDIAERGIAQPFNDPTTAIMAIDRLHDSLRQLATRSFPTGRHNDGGGDVRLIERTLGWDGYVRLAFDELRLAGAASPQVPRRISPHCMTSRPSRHRNGILRSTDSWTFSPPGSSNSSTTGPIDTPHSYPTNRASDPEPTSAAGVNRQSVPRGAGRRAQRRDRAPPPGIS
ncbi:DUF2254 family protein [Pseudonocardia sp. MH-G8]|uniref:DUF2254 family protein n=1 Tax=Pseudonocardia sp. MH-G8 TaxID=1854588 RepID=UPI002100F951|nr:DUF2254 family protein [Pseudonocardia sp. MH-G8]